MSKAIVQQIQVGNISFEGLMLPDGSFGISLQQLRVLAFPKVTPNNAKRTLTQVANTKSDFSQNEKKSLEPALGKGFQLLRVATELGNNPQWVVSIDDITFLLTELAFAGHTEARQLVRLLTGLSLQQLFCDAFGVRFEVEDRQQWLVARMESIVVRNEYTGAIRDTQGEGYTRYGTATDLIYLGLYQKTAKQLSEELGGPVRDRLTSSQLEKVKMVEKVAAKFVKDGEEPITAGYKALATMSSLGLI